MTYDFEGRTFTVKPEGDDFAVSLDGRCAGYFFVTTGEVTVRGRYMNVAESDEVILAVGKQYVTRHPIAA